MTLNFEFDRAEASNRLNIFIDFVKKTHGYLEQQPGMKKQARENYRNKGTLPSAPILATWSKIFDLNVNWLLTGEGDMFIRAGETGHSTQMALDEKDRLIAELLLENRELRKQLEKK